MAINLKVCGIISIKLYLQNKYYKINPGSGPDCPEAQLLASGTENRFESQETWLHFLTRPLTIHVTQVNSVNFTSLWTVLIATERIHIGLLFQSPVTFGLHIDWVQVNSIEEKWCLPSQAWLTCPPMNISCLPLLFHEGLQIGMSNIRHISWLQEALNAPHLLWWIDYKMSHT